MPSDLTDLVERLREGIYWNGALRQAADEIERLREHHKAKDDQYCSLTGQWANAEGGIERLQEAREYATRLLLVLMEKHFPGQKIEPLGDIFGVIDQIDSLTTALVRADGDNHAVIVARRDVRNDALEEAAKVAEINNQHWITGIDRAIRAMKEQS